ncbi:uncharacterized protein OCT59_027823 [Rhizophagus irregularis]|uniref:Transmembrane protein n=2 Tax=Rhizophagus irregularis TaxID=588596 RepID=A0A015JFS3_RHIIW|nr:hypothetical protein GLOIN_2v1470415 [Rhizophagus irregularis DAOM 181602=DAOM 197198]EXX65960.1 hypothetical protein RirG_128280 [Rhizophagus irregularis DAOM 197198w]UZO07539.1 hypothetical protein OCT59_027823 [Rhizophagus irregularis]POG81872.1 hypothetical protein GLOIN_2v1470415 [Rhizophagus irregularis DAOM 181602=DAOM 197198]CAG8616544.1 19474_t:CDS:1 [Rhizophagus irregularis]GBC15604.1 hypothetical protein GLOIN_2v1470415 [Rhizophagus irregularis DAOM 181602=DAOM 197198]|eukprot:XP_025188738.1 hypothetical protein GLOIN_2v1470415 [Rhizophagus irregularis DAOM 181602=DAOM 197198]
MPFLFIIFITFLCPFVSAQVSADDYAQKAFLGYIDVLINFMVPLIIFVIVDYEYDDYGSSTLVYLTRSIVYFVNICIQQELAFIFSPVRKVSNFIKILQHIVVVLFGIEIIGNFYIFFKTKTKTEEEKVEKEFKKQILVIKQALKEIVKAQNEQIKIVKQTLEDSFKTQIQTLKKSFEENTQKQIQALKKSLEVSVQKKIQPLKKSFEEHVQTFKQSFEEGIRTIEQSFGESIKTQIQTLEENLNKNFLPKRVYQPKFQILEERVKTLEQKIEPPSTQATFFSHFLTCMTDFIETSKAKFPTLNSISNENLKSTETLLRSSNSENLKSTETLLRSSNSTEYPKSTKNLKSTLRSSNSTENRSTENRSKKIFIQSFFLVNYTALTLFVIVLGFLLNDLKENFTQSFVVCLIITISLTSIIQFTILIMAYRRGNLEVYIKKNQEIYKDILPKYQVYIFIIEEFINVNVLYLPSLINYFLLQTPDIFNKIFLNLSALLVTVWIIIMYKLILKNEGIKNC